MLGLGFQGGKRRVAGQQPPDGNRIAREGWQRQLAAGPAQQSAAWQKEAARNEQTPQPDAMLGWTNGN